MEEARPSIIAMGCQSHGMALLIKDLSQPAKCKWAADTYSVALKISNLLDDSCKIKLLVKGKMVERFGQVRYGKWAWQQRPPPPPPTHACRSRNSAPACDCTHTAASH